MSELNQDNKNFAPRSFLDYLFSDRTDCIVTDAVEFWLFSGDLERESCLTPVDTEELVNDDELMEALKQFDVVFQRLCSDVPGYELMSLAKASIRYAIHFVAAAVSAEKERTS